MMKKNKTYIYKGVKAIVVCLLLGFATTACSDWNDHYATDISSEGSANNSLWENIKGNAQLSEFADLVQKAGYTDVLNSSQTYTVWAPLNGTFDYATLAQEANAVLRKEFIQNHIAHNNYPATGTINERIFMLNEKVMNFSGNGSYSMDGISIAQVNLPGKNGVIHSLNGKLPFFENVYEAINTNTFPLDSLSKYYHSYDINQFDPSKSVVGPTINGEITYLDSVFYENNTLYNRYNAYINREDSSYTMLLPTNTAWVKSKARLRNYFNYISKLISKDPMLSGSEASKEITVKHTVLRDSLVDLYNLAGLTFNNNIAGNRPLKQLQTGQQLTADSLISTVNNRVYNEDTHDLFVGAQRINKSNGAVWVTDSIRIKSWNLWNPVITVQGEQSGYLAGVESGSSSRVTVLRADQNPDVAGSISGNAYREISPANASSNPSAHYYLPNILSTTYSIYVVFVPANILTNNVERIAPNIVQVTVSAANANGRVSERTLRTVRNDVTKVDTVYCGDFTFPVAYRGIENCNPYISLKSRVTAAQYNNKQNDRTMRIDCILLIPKELDTYRTAHPGYKYFDPFN